MSTYIVKFPWSGSVIIQLCRVNAKSKEGEKKEEPLRGGVPTREFRKVESVDGGFSGEGHVVSVEAPLIRTHPSIGQLPSSARASRAAIL